MRLTRAAAKRWFAREFPGLAIERYDGRSTFFVSHRPDLLCVRYGAFAFVNAHHPSYGPR